MKVVAARTMSEPPLSFGCIPLCQFGADLLDHQLLLPGRHCAVGRDVLRLPIVITGPAGVVLGIICHNKGESLGK